MDGRGVVVPSCCPGVPGLSLTSALAAGSGRFLHNAFVLPKDQVEVIQDQKEILLRNNSDHAVHIPSDQEGGLDLHSSSTNTKNSEGGGSLGSRSSSRRSQQRGCSGGCQCSLPRPPPGLFSCIPRVGGGILNRLLCDPLLTKRILVMIILAIIITTMTVLTWYFTTSHAERSVTIVADALRSDLLARAEATTNGLLHNSNLSSTALARLLSSQLIPGYYSSFTTLEQQVRPILFSAYSVIPQRNMVSFYGKNGLFIAYSSEVGGASVSFANLTYLHPQDNTSTDIPWSTGENISVTRPWYKWYQQSADSETGLPTGEVTSISSIPYWALNIFNNTWSGGQGANWGVLSSQSNDLYILSLSLVKQENNSDAVGAAGVGFSVSEIGNYLNNIDLQGGDMYITTVDGKLLVQTNMSVDYEIGQLGTPLLPSAADSNNSVVAGAAQFLASIPGRDVLQPYQANNVNIGGKQYVLNSSPVDIQQTTLICVVLIPRDSLWGLEDKRRYMVFALLLTLSISVGIVGFFCIILLTRGVSTERRLRSALMKQIEATKQAENKSSHKSIMFASMSHDLRTPLAAILGLIDLCLCDAVESTELESNLSQMKSCATNLLDILNSILDMSKIEAGKLQLDESEFDLLDVLEEAVEMFAVVGMMKGLEVVLDLPDDSIEKSPIVLGDPGRVKQLLANLLSNGVKFTNSGHVVLRAWRKPSRRGDPGSGDDSRTGMCGCFSAWKSWLAGEELWKDGDGSFSNVNLVEYEFEVDDTGKGIPHSRRKAVFENFEQVDNSVPSTHGGTGLGLGIVRSLVRLMGGDIHIIDKDEPGEPGARFRFNLLLQVNRDSMANTNGVSLRSKLNDPTRESDLIRRTDTTAAVSKGLSSLEVPSVSQQSLVYSQGSNYSAKRIEGVHVLLAMQGQAGKKAAKQWMERHGLQVWTVGQHQEFLPTLEKIKYEVFYEQSFCWSECFEINPVGPNVNPEEFETLDINNAPAQPVPPQELHALPSSRDHKRLFSQRAGPRLLLIIDIAMVSSILEALSVSLQNALTQGDMNSVSKVVWLVTPNTPSMILQTLKQGDLPCDLVLHKPLNVSRLRIIGELVQFLIQNREMGSTGELRRPSFSLSFGGNPLGDGRGIVPPPSPMPSLTTLEGITQEFTSGELYSGTLAGEGNSGTYSGTLAGAGNSGTIAYEHNNLARTASVESCITEFSADARAMETQALVPQPWSSPSPEVGPFPRIRARETDIMGPPNPLKGMHILVAEDNSVLQRLTKTTLLKLGATVECVDNGLEAAQMVLQNLPRKGSSRSASFGSMRRVRSISRENIEDESPAPRKRPFDMVLMDCQMPVLDGYGATRRIREQEKLLGWQTPVIALTAHAMAKDESKCIEAGMDFYLTKPLATKALLNVVAKINVNAERQN